MARQLIGFAIALVIIIMVWALATTYTKTCVFGHRWHDKRGGFTEIDLDADRRVKDEWVMKDPHGPGLLRYERKCSVCGQRQYLDEHPAIGLWHDL